MARVADIKRDENGELPRAGAGWFTLGPIPAGRLAWLLGALLLLSRAGIAPAASFTTTLDRNVVPVGETVTPGVSQASEFSFANGQRTSKQTYSYTLLATQPGDLTIPPIAVQVGGKTLTSQPLQLKIVPANSSAANPSVALTNFAFLRLIVPKTEAY